MTPTRRLRAVDLVLAALAVATVVRFVVASGPAEDSIPFRLRLGLSVPPIGIDWSSAPRTLVLVVRSTCPACEKSTGFYARLAAQLAAANVPLRVVSEETTEVVGAWLAGASINPVAVTPRTDLATLGLVATPTLLLVDSSGVVTDIWVGVLSKEDEVALDQRLRGDRHQPLTNLRVPAVITRSEWTQLRARGDVLLDVRDRGSFAESSTDGAINIPSDELVDRGPFELDLTRRFVIDCLHSSFSRCEVGAEILGKTGVKEIAILVRRR